MSRFSIFYGGISNCNPEPKAIDINEVIRLISLDTELKHNVENVRKAKENKEKNPDDKKAATSTKIKTTRLFGLLPNFLYLGVPYPRCI